MGMARLLANCRAKIICIGLEAVILFPLEIEMQPTATMMRCGARGCQSVSAQCATVAFDFRNAPAGKHQHWRGLQTENALNASPMPVFALLAPLFTSVRGEPVEPPVR
jgi:hypothetical protein